MTDQQLDDSLTYVADDVRAGLTDPSFIEDIPADLRSTVADYAARIGTVDGRRQIATEFRELSKTAPHGMVDGLETVDTSQLQVDGGVIGTVPFSAPGGVLSGHPTGAGTRVDDQPDGFNIAFGPASAAPCRAPGGIGTVAAPADLAPGQFITPQRDVYTATSEGILAGTNGPLSVTGAEPIAGGGPGIELRNGLAGTQQMHVQINLDDSKNFGPGGLGAIVTIRRIGDTAANETRPVLVTPRVYCYAGDTRTDRGYLDAWIPLPRSEPGFQIIAEVVENDSYFANCPFGPNCDFALAQPGPAYWAGADRATIHAGAPTLTTAGPIADAVGAFASATPDVGASGSNVLTDTNNDPTDDTERAIAGLLDSTIRSAANGALSGSLFDIGIVQLTAALNQPLDNQIDLRFTTPQDGPQDYGEPAGHTGALRADIAVNADIGLEAAFAGLVCKDLRTNVSVDLEGNAWANSAGSNTSVVPRFSHTRDIDVSMSLSRFQWVNPTCLIVAALNKAFITDYFVKRGFDSALGEVLYGKLSDECKNDRRYFGSSGQVLDPYSPLPAECREAGVIEKLVQELDLNDFIPEVQIGNTLIAPKLTDVNNAWCSTSTAPAGCSENQDLLGINGAGVMADAALVSSLGDALGTGLGGRFRNVFRPRTTSSVAELVSSHRDSKGATPGLGVIIDPALINLSLRHLSQGSSTTRETNGLLDQSDIALPINDASVSTRPEVPPMVLGIRSPQEHSACNSICSPDIDPTRPASSSFIGFVAPDVRLTLQNGPGAPVEYSLAAAVEARVTAGAGFSSVTPALGTTTVDLLVTGGCQADYVNFYALSYTLCGRGNSGSGIANDQNRPFTLGALLNYAVNELVLPLVTDSFGSINLPSLSRIVPNLNLSLKNVQSSLRGGFLAVYADLQKGPKFSVQTSVAPLSTIAHFERCCVDNIDLSLPTTYRWEVRDLATGAIVTTGVVDPTDPSKIDVPLSSFQAKRWPNGSYGIRGHAQLTITQAGLEVGSGGIVNVHKRDPDDEAGPLCPPEARAIVC